MKWIIAILLIIVLNFLQVAIRHELDIYPESILMTVLIGFVIGVIVVPICSLDERRYY